MSAIKCANYAGFIFIIFPYMILRNKINPNNKCMVTKVGNQRI